MNTDTLDYTPQPAKDTAWQMLMIRLGVTRRNLKDARVATARTAREFAEAGATMLARVGGK